MSEVRINTIQGIRVGDHIAVEVNHFAQFDTLSLWWVTTPSTKGTRCHFRLALRNPDHSTNNAQAIETLRYSWDKAAAGRGDL